MWTLTSHSISTDYNHTSSHVLGDPPVVNTPNAHNVAAMPAFGPKGVADVSRKRMMGLVKIVTPQLKRLNFCVGTASTSKAHVQGTHCEGSIKARLTDAISLP